MLRWFHRIILLVMVCIILTQGFGSGTAASDYADTILLNGSVYTVEPGTDWDKDPQEGIALKGDSILAIGSSAEMRDYSGPDTAEYDLAGKMVLPGFVDTHIHLGMAAQLQAGVDLANCTTVPEVLDLLTDFAAAHPDDEVIRGSGWRYFLFPGSEPEKGIIDDIVADKPVILTAFDGHTTWVNSKALEVAGITNTTPDPMGGKIERDSEGNPTGVLREMAAANLVTTAVAPIPPEQIAGALRELLPQVAAQGVTMVDDAAVYPDIIAAFAILDAEGGLPLRVNGEMIVIPDLGSDEIPVLEETRALFSPGYPKKDAGMQFEDNLPVTLGDLSDHLPAPDSLSRYRDDSGLLRFQTAKLFLDGVVEAHTGYLIEPYSDRPEMNGTITWDPDEFSSVIAELDEDGFQIDIHAIGDGAVRMSLDAYEQAREKNGIRDSRHKISHVLLINRTDIPRFASNGVIAAMQPNWFYYNKNFMNSTLPFLGRERAEHMAPLKSILDSGAIVAFGTDYPVGSDYLTFNPLDGIRTAVTRLPLPPDSPDHPPYSPDERVDLKTALTAATYTGAYTNFMENQTGSLEVGKLADIVVLDKDIFTLPAEEINSARVVATFLEGKTVYMDNSSGGMGS